MRSRLPLMLSWLLVTTPSYASDATPSVRDLFGNAAFTSPRLSPDGARIAALASRGDLQVIVTRALSGGAMATHGKFTSPSSRFAWLTWAKPDVLWVAASTESDPRSFIQFRAIGHHAVQLPSGEVKALGYGARLLHRLPGDPKRVLVDRHGEVTTMEAFEGTVAEEPLLKHRREVMRWHADGAGHVRAGEGLTDGRYLLLARAGPDAEFEQVLAWNARDAIGARFLAFHDDPARVFVAGPHEGREAVFTLDLASRELSLAFAHPELDVGAVEIDESRGRVVAARYLADRPQAHFFDSAEARLHGDLASAVERELGGPIDVEIVSRDRSGRILLAEASSAWRPPVFLIYDREHGSLTRLIEERPQLAGKALAQPRRIDVVARDGLRLRAYLTLPLELPTGPLALIVLVHGGPSSRDALRWDPRVQLFATRGFAVLQVNFRGSEGYGRAFLEAGHREWAGKMQDDLADAVRQLAAKGVVDVQRVGIFGASYGGFAALMGPIATPDLYRAAAAYAPVTDLRSLIAGEGSYRSSYRNIRLAEELGGGWKDRARIDAASPKRRVREIGVPILLGHGGKDGTVPVKHSRKMAAALRRADKPFEYLEFEHEIHGFLLEANRVRWYEALIAFFEKNLAPRETPSPNSPAGDTPS